MFVEGVKLLMSPCLYSPEHKVYTYDDSESPRGRASPSCADDVSELKETPEKPHQSSTPRANRDAELKPKEQDDQGDQLKVSRCLSDPGPNPEDDEDSTFLPWVKHILQERPEDKRALAKLNIYHLNCCMFVM